VDGLDLKLAIVNGTGNAKKLLDKIRSGEAEYHFIEIMGCPGGYTILMKWLKLEN